MPTTFGGRSSRNMIRQTSLVPLKTADRWVGLGCGFHETLATT